MAGPIKKTTTTTTRRVTTRRKTSGARNTIDAIVKKAEKAISGKNLLGPISALGAGLRAGRRAPTKGTRARKAPRYRG